MDVRHPPQHVGPPPTMPRAMRIAIHVAVLMMDAVDRHPTQRAPLRGERTEHGQQVFHELGGLKTPVRKQPVVAHGDAEAREQVEHETNHQSRPGKGEGRQHDAGLNEAPPENLGPVEPGTAGASSGAGKG